MVIDVVGYSRLMDEAGTARAVREHREAAQCDSDRGESAGFAHDVLHVWSTSA
jgi:hypothetical protein